MFLNLLRPDQQIAFIHAARAVAEQDGQVTEVEVALLDGLRAECGLAELPPTEADADVAGMAADVLQDDVARRVFMLELAGVALIDGEAHPAEVELVGAFGAALGVTGDALAEMLAFAERGQRLILDGRRIIATGTAG